MDSFFFTAGSALWLGILTAISPCPMATNIAAISYIARRVENPRRVLLTGLLYTVGRMVAYVVVGMLVVWSILSIPQVSNSLQKIMHLLLGPVLILAGVFILGLLNISASGSSGLSERLGRRVETLGLWGAGLLGIIFALSFCPVSAALFFGSLIPLAVKFGSIGLMPSIYGIGTALPVLVFAILLAYGAHSVGRLFQRLSQIERWARRVTGVVFILIGIYLSLTNIFGITI
ncbi:sulfite exporter TauE/SafE family protein [bacterium]|nr:sulfite exporter TauE/SafE family protein [bacterium]